MNNEKRSYDRETTMFVGVRLPSDLRKALFDKAKNGETSASQIIIEALADKLSHDNKMSVAGK